MSERVATWEKPGPGTWELDSSHFGAAGAMTDIPDGATVEIDPVAGLVRVL